MATGTGETFDAPATRSTQSADWSSILYFILHGIGFVGSTLLMTWGLFFLLFLALGGFTFDGLIRQLNNFTTRYIVADASRTDGFLTMFALAHLILSTAVITFRRDKLLPERNLGRTPQNG